jgi:hypothetical protein
MNQFVEISHRMQSVLPAKSRRPSQTFCYSISLFTEMFVARRTVSVLVETISSYSIRHALVSSTVMHSTPC